MRTLSELTRWRNEGNPKEESVDNDVVLTTLSSTLFDLMVEANPTLEAFATGDSRDDLARYGLCLILEAAELVNSLPWKRWARHPPDLEKSKEEFADLLCFLGSMVGLINRLGVGPHELAQAYIEKTKENRKRFAVYQQENPRKETDEEIIRRVGIDWSDTI